MDAFAVTTLITTYQRPKLLLKAIKSAQQQTLPPHTILISDSASQDETAELVSNLAKEDSRIIYYCHPHVISSTENYQFGIDQIRTPFFSILSDDDLLLPHFYQTATGVLRKYPEAEFFLGSTLDASMDGKLISAAALEWPDQELFHPHEGLRFIITSYFNWTGAVYRTKSAQAHSLNRNIVPSDYDWILRLAAHYPFVFSKKPCALFMHHAGSFSGYCGLKLVSPSVPLIAEAICQIRPPAEQTFLKAAFQKAYHRKLLQIAIQCVTKDRLAELKEIEQELTAPFAKMMNLSRRFAICRFFLKRIISLYRWIRQRHLRRYFSL